MRKSKDEYMNGWWQAQKRRPSPPKAVPLTEEELAAFEAARGVTRCPPGDAADADLPWLHNNAFSVAVKP